MFLLSVINRNAHNNNAHSAGHKNMNKVVCVSVSICLPVSLSLSVCRFLSVLHVNWPSIVWLIKMSSAAPSSHSHSLHLPQSNLLIAIYTDLPLPYRASACMPACGLSHVPSLLPALTISPSYRQLVSAQPAGSFQSETCAVLFLFIFCSFGLALISDQG